MNIGFDAKRAFLNATGLGNYSRLLIRSLQEHFPDHRYFLYSPKGTAWDGGEIRSPRGLAALAPSLWRSFGIPRDFRRVGLDLYHGLSNELPVAAGPTGVKRVVTIHDLIFLRYPRFYSPVDRRTYLWKCRHAVRRADAVVAVSEQTRRDVVEFLEVPEDRVRVVYQGYDPRFDEAASPEVRAAVARRYDLPERYLLSVGTVEERKNLLTVVRALERMAGEPTLVVAGRHRAYYRTVASWLERHRLAHRVKFLRSVPAEDLPALYQGADVFLYPSLFEGFGIPLLEALASGVPVVTSRGSCFAEAAGPGSRYVDPRSPEELAAAVDDILGDAGRRRAMVEAGRRHAEGFRPGVLARGMVELYESL